MVIVATGLVDGTAEEIAREVERAQMMAGSFRPLFVIDSADFAPFRRRGYIVERVMRADEFAATNPDDSYGDYLFTRLAGITRSYRAASVVPMPATSLEALRGPMLRLIGAVPPKLSREIQAATAQPPRP